MNLNHPVELSQGDELRALFAFYGRIWCALRVTKDGYVELHFSNADDVSLCRVSLSVDDIGACPG